MAALAASPPPSFKALEPVFGKQLTDDLALAIRENASSNQRGPSIGVRHFLAWLGTSGAPLVAHLSDPSSSSMAEPQAIALMISAVRAWMTETLSSGFLAPMTVTGYGLSIVAALEWLGATPERRYPRFRAEFVSVPKGVGDVPTLGLLGWPVLGDVMGVDRERLALRVAREAATAAFHATEAIFAVGQSILRGQPASPCDGLAASSLKILLEAEAACWRLTGRSQFAPGATPSVDALACKAAWTDPRSWIEVGIPRAAVPLPSTLGSSRLHSNQVASLAMACLGPTYAATVAAMTAFCCDTGWNRQPIIDLPREPFAYRTASEAGIATGGFVRSFKRRAGHDVLAYLERDQELIGLVEESASQAWRACADGPGPIDDGHATVARTSPLVDLLQRYRVMAEAARPFDPKGRFSDSFFAYMTRSHGMAMNPDTNVRHPSSGLFVDLKGLSFQSIRKTVLSLKTRDVGSVLAARPFAGHTGTGVLMPHYLNTASVNAELDESIRFFQGVLQSLVLEGRDAGSLVIGMPARDLEWFRRLAVASGVAAACGVVGESRPVQEGVLRFDPTDENLVDLYLAHRALRQARRRVGVLRWKVQALPLLACVKAIGRALLAKGLRLAYLKAARRAAAGLAVGIYALPVVLDA